MKYILDKLEQTLAATIIAFCLILIFSIAVAVYFYTLVSARQSNSVTTVRISWLSPSRNPVA